MEDEKYINKVSQGGQILRNKKNYLFAIALAAIAFNCEAWNIENQKDSIGIVEKNNKLYYGKDELTTKEGDSLRDSLHNCEKIIKYAWDCRDEDSFKNVVSVDAFNASLENKKPQEQNALKNGLVLLYYAHKCFADLGVSYEIDDIVKECARKFGFSATDELKHDIDWYLTDKKWALCAWIGFVLDSKSTKKNNNDIFCCTAESYRRLKQQQKLKLEKLHIVLDFSEWQRFSPEEQEEIRKAKRKLKSFELVLTMADFDEHYKGKNEFTIPGCVTKIEDDVLDKLKTLKIKIKVEIAKDSCVELFKLLSRCCDNKVIANIEGKDIDIEIGKGVDEDDTENIYFECRYDELRSKGISIKSVPAWITIYYEIPKDKNNFKKFKKAKYKYGNKIITRINGINVDIQVYKDDDGNRYCECSYDELLEKRINIESVPYRITIYYEITNDKNNFGAFKKAKYKHESGIIARIDGHDVDIEVDKDDYGNLYCECSYDNYTNILPTYSFIRQKLYIYFESCNELIKTVSNGQEVAEKQLEPKDIIALIENFKKKHGCNGVMARLTKDDIDLYIDKNDTSDRKESSIAIPEYVKKITDDAFDNLKEDVTEMTIEGKYLLGRANVHELIRRMASLRTIYVPDDVDITLLKRYLMKPSIEIEYISKKPKK